MPPYWVALNFLAALLQFSFGILAIAHRRFWQAPAWAVACLWSVIPQGHWLLTIGHSGGGRVRASIVTVGLLVRLAVTYEAIHLLLFTDPERGSYRARIAWYAGLALASLALLEGVSFQGYVRIFCWGALAVAIVVWMVILYPTMEYARQHAGLMFVWLGSAAMASAAGAKTGDVWDVGATLAQCACYALWLSDLFRRSACRNESPRGG